jgi:hypothetical protein
VRQVQVLQDWIRVENYQVDAGEVRTYEFHVVRDEEHDRVTLTIKCLDGEEKTIRLDPTVLNPGERSFPEIAERRIRRLYSLGLI